MTELLDVKLTVGDLLKIGVVFVVFAGMYFGIQSNKEKHENEVAARISEDKRIEGRMENRTGRNSDAIAAEDYSDAIWELRLQVLRLECRQALGDC